MKLIAGGTLLYIANHLAYQNRNNLNLYIVQPTRITFQRLPLIIFFFQLCLSRKNQAI